MEQFTAAHRTLPFNTWVDVTDLDNGKHVEVRIIDRGPFVDGRIIDLSLAAARSIAMLGPGIARVRLKVIPRSGDRSRAGSRCAACSPRYLGGSGRRFFRRGPGRGVRCLGARPI